MCVCSGEIAQTVSCIGLSEPSLIGLGCDTYHPLLTFPLRCTFVRKCSTFTKMAISVTKMVRFVVICSTVLILFLIDATI